MLINSITTPSLHIKYAKEMENMIANENDILKIKIELYIIYSLIKITEHTINTNYSMLNCIGTNINRSNYISSLDNDTKIKRNDLFIYESEKNKTTIEPEIEKNHMHAENINYFNCIRINHIHLEWIEIFSIHSYIHINYYIKIKYIKCKNHIQMKYIELLLTKSIEPYNYKIANSIAISIRKQI